MNRFISQLKGAPVRNHQFFGIQLLEGCNRLPGVHMAGRHKPARLVGTQVDDRQVDVELPSDFTKSVEVGRIAGNIDRFAGCRFQNV